MQSGVAAGNTFPYGRKPDAPRRSGYCFSQAATVLRFHRRIGARSSRVDAPQKKNPKDTPAIFMTEPARKFPNGVEPC